MSKLHLLLLLLLLVTAYQPAQAQEFAPTWQDIVPGYWERSSLPQTGLATYYAAGLMESVQWRREANGQIVGCPECVGAVALLRAGDIGRRVWLQAPGGEPIGPFLVVDCARRQDVLPLMARNWAVDISYELGQIWGMIAPLDGVTILEDPADIDAAAAGWDASRLVPTPFYVPPGAVEISLPTPTPADGPTDPALPPRWPTRLPAPLPGRPIRVPPTIDASVPTPEPTPTPGTPLPTPLTPVVTTPTPAVMPEAPTPVTPLDGSQPVTPLPTAPPTALPEIALGRAGAALLVADGMLAEAEATLPAISPAPTRTPRPDSTPLLPAILPTPVPAGPIVESPILRLWRELLEALGRD